MKLKRFFAAFIAVLTALVMALPFVACNNTPPHGGTPGGEPGGNTPVDPPDPDPNPNPNPNPDPDPDPTDPDPTDPDPTEPCVHVWVPATCITPEYCSVCNTTRGGLAAHKYETKTVAATCDSDGHTDKECTICHIKTTERIPQLSHNYKSKVEQGDCETDTVTTFTCELCYESYSEVTARHTGHNSTGAVWTEKSAEHIDDSECMYLVIEAADCAACGHEMTRSYIKHEFSPVVKTTVAATCNTKGKIEYGCECQNPLYNYSVELAVNPAAHEWGAPSDPTKYTHECSVCHETKAEVSIQGISGTIAAADIKEKVAIKTVNDVTLAPDTTLVSKMSAGAGVKIEAVPKEVNDLPDGTEQSVKEKLEGAPIYDFGLKTADNDEPIDFDGGKMTISLPYTLEPDEDPSSVVVWYIKDDGTVEYIDAVYGNGFATFTAEHFSYYTVVRLTAEERCNKLGHDYLVTEFEPTCTEDGYTVKNCKRCGDFVRTVGGSKLGHDYNAVVVAPTCAEKGYTLNTCKHEGCEESYISKYTDKKAHDYKDTVVAPTCTAKGYTQHTCKNCDYSFRDTVTDAVEHNYVNNECTVCHKKIEAATADNFYINLLKSIGYTDNIYVELNDISFGVVIEFDEGSQEIYGECSVYKLQVTVDEDGYLVGSGDGKFKYTLIDGGTPSVAEMRVALALKNKKFYMYSNQTETYSGTKQMYEQYMVMSQDDESLGLAVVKQYVEAYYSNAVKKVIGLLLDSNVKDNPLHLTVNKAMEFLFTKTKTASGFTLTLNYENVGKAIEFMNEHNAAEVIDAVLGEGVTQTLIDFAKALPEMTLDEFVTKLFIQAQAYNLKPDNIYAVVDSVLTSLGIDLGGDAKTFIENNKEKTVPQVVAMFMSDATADEIAAMITEQVEYYAELITDESMSLTELIYYSCTDATPDTPNTMPITLEYIITALDALNAAARDKITVVINTDGTGDFVSTGVVFYGFEFDYKVPSFDGDGEMNVTANADLSYLLKSESEVLNDNGNIVSTIDSARTTFVNAIKSGDGKKYVGQDNLQMQIVEHGGEYYLLPVIDASNLNKLIQQNTVIIGNPSEGEYNGTPCTAVNLIIQNVNEAYRLDLNGSEYSYSKSCGSWTENGISAYRIENMSYVMYATESGTILDIMPVWDTFDISTGYVYSAKLYHNAAQSKFSAVDPHSYVLVEQKDPTKCEETGYEKYRCTACGITHYNYYTLWHEYKYSFELKDAKLGCAGGVIETKKCSLCNKEVRKEIDGVNKDGSHAMFKIDTPLDTDCGGTVFSETKCLCGENVHYMGVEGNCYFNMVSNVHCETNNDGKCEHGYANHVTELHQCTVTACGYKYTREVMYTEPDANCKVIKTYKYTLADNSVHSYSEQRTDHAKEKDSVTQDGDITVTTTVCERCHNTVRTVKTDSYDRIVYYYDEIEKHGYEKEYNGCEYTEYYLDENKERDGGSYGSVEHQFGGYQTPEKTSCTQPVTVQQECSVCHYTQSHEHYFGHDNIHDGDTGLYKCSYCGLESKTPLNGPIILENLSEKNGGISIGYLLQDYYEINYVEYYTDYVDDGNGERIDGISGNYNNTGSRSGILTVDVQSVKAWLDKPENEGKSLTVVVVSSHLKEGGAFEMSITFTAEELAELLAQ